MKLNIPDCRLFTGYAPCEPGKKCLECKNEYPFGTKILIINLDAMGDVLMTTAQLPAIKRKYPQSHISWLTLNNAAPLLQNNPYIDKIYIWDDEMRLILSVMHFNIAMNADKNQNSGAIMMSLNADRKVGFGIDKSGAIIPLNEGAIDNYKLGLDDEYKFHLNKKTGQEILAETFELDYQRDEYILNLSDEEKAFCNQIRQQYGINESDVVIGFNTGCSSKWPQKKMTIDQHVSLVHRIHNELAGIKVLLLGGREDTERNQKIEQLVKEKVINTPTTMGLRKGLCFINLADIVVTGDSLGMHAAIGLKKQVIVWFGMSCEQEIDLYDRGIKLVADVNCAPCWNANCRNYICVAQLNLDEIFSHVKNIYQKFKNGLIKREPV